MGFDVFPAREFYFVSSPLSKPFHDDADAGRDVFLFDAKSAVEF